MCENNNNQQAKMEEMGTNKQHATFHIKKKSLEIIHKIMTKRRKAMDEMEIVSANTKSCKK